MENGQKPSQSNPPGNNGLKLITCVVQRGRADKLMKAAIAAGAGGATVFFARGIGVRERLGLLGLAIVPEKEVIKIVCEKSQVKPIFDALVKAGDINTPGHGIAYVSAIEDVAGFFPGIADEALGE